MNPLGKVLFLGSDMEIEVGRIDPILAVVVNFLKNRLDSVSDVRVNHQGLHQAFQLFTLCDRTAAVIRVVN